MSSTTTNSGPWRPDWAVTPGAILREALEERHMSQVELARRIDRPTKTVSEIIHGKAAVTPETALQLELALGIDAEIWVQLEARYRAFVARQEAEGALSGTRDWTARFPIKEMVRERLIERTTDETQLARTLLRFFGVASPAAWARVWETPLAHLRRGKGGAVSESVTSVWLRWGELQAKQQRTGAFSDERFRSALAHIRTVTREPVFDFAVAEAVRACGDAGVALLVLPDFAGTRLSGAAYWLSKDQAVIQLTLRYKLAEEFWESLMHECGHLALHPRTAISVDGESVRMNSEQELEADAFAWASLVPDAPYGRFAASTDWSREDVRTFARSIDISPGLVVAFAQMRGDLARTHLNDLKQPVHWSRAR